MTGQPTGTVTFLFTDIEGSTKLAREHPEEWEAAQTQHHKLLREAIESHSGFVFQIIGDAFCAAFYKAGEALQAAYRAQQALHGQAWGEMTIRVRMGIHTGEAEVQENGYHGYLTLSLVQRLMSAGHGGQILVSGATENLLRDQLPKDIRLLDLGKHAFRDVPQPIRVFQVGAAGLSGEFPPLRTVPSHPNNLPTQLTSFVGREKELADLQKLLLDTHILTLIGPGGTGKTRLSLQVASALLDRFPDGLWLVELAPVLDPLLVPRVTAMTMGLRDEPQRPVIDMLCDYLREKKMLIVLDNCEHLVDACARMADRILHAAPDVRILASSREALGIGGEVTYRVPSLGLPDLVNLPPLESMSQYEAVKLFIDRARAAIPSFSVTNENAPAVAQICHRLDGIPLAIELAAAKIRVLGVEQIAKRLDDRFRLLTGGSRTALERHQTLRAAIDWSYNLLPSAEQALFRRLSVFVGGWTLEAAESVCVDELIKNAEVLEFLEQLIHKSLALMEERQGETRYSMLETMRQYANEKLVEAGESETSRDRHLDYFLNLSETAAPHLIRPEQLEWLAKLDADYENLHQALEWALNKESAEPSLRLCAALGWFWWVRSYLLEGIRWLEQALSKPSQPSKAEKIVRVRALYHDAALANWLDDLERMKRSAESSLALAQEVSDRRNIAIARFYVGWSFDRYYDYDHAIPLMQESLRDFQQIKDAYWESVVYRWLGNILMKRGDIPYEEHVRRHLEFARRAGERENLAQALSNWVYQLFTTNHLEEAEKYAEEASLLSRQIQIHPDELSRFYAHRAWLRGNYKETKEILKEIIKRSYAIGDRNLGSLATGDLGFLALQEGEIDQAYIHFEGALAVAREIGNKESIATRLAELGNTFYIQGKMKGFKENYQESFSLGKELGVLSKRTLLMLILDVIHPRKPQFSAQVLGAIYNSLPPTHPLWKRYYDRAEAHARNVLGADAFETAFAEGQKMSMDQALDLAQKTVEEM